MAKQHLLTSKDEERFWGKVEQGTPDECWPWSASRYLSGYGQFRKGSKGFYAHRLAYWFASGPYDEHLCICHHCDNPPCCNPRHLYLGTRADNNRDRGQRRRGKEHRQNGEANDNAKLEESDVRAIIAALSVGETQTSVASRFGIKQPQVSRIARRESWSHLWRDE